MGKALATLAEHTEWPVVLGPGHTKMFDWTINLGQVGIALTFVFSLGVWATAQKYALVQVKDQIKRDAEKASELAANAGAALAAANAAHSLALTELKLSIGERLTKLEARMDDQNKIMVAIARQEQRLDTAEDNIDNINKRITEMVRDIGNIRMFQQVPTKLIEATRDMG